MSAILPHICWSFLTTIYIMIITQWFVVLHFSYNYYFIYSYKSNANDMVACMWNFPKQFLINLVLITWDTTACILAIARLQMNMIDYNRVLIWNPKYGKFISVGYFLRGHWVSWYYFLSRFLSLFTPNDLIINNFLLALKRTHSCGIFLMAWWR